MRRRRPQTDPPEDLTGHEWGLLWAWAEKHEPWCLAQVGEIGDLVARCLDHHRALGNTMADWPAAVRNWIRNERLFRARTGDGFPQQARRRGVANAAREVAHTLGLFDEGGELH